MHKELYIHPFYVEVTTEKPEDFKKLQNLLESGVGCANGCGDPEEMIDGTIDVNVLHSPNGRLPETHFFRDLPVRVFTAGASHLYWYLWGLRDGVGVSDVTKKSIATCLDHLNQLRAELLRLAGLLDRVEGDHHE